MKLTRSRPTSGPSRRRGGPTEPVCALWGRGAASHFHQLDARDRLRVQSRKTDKAAERTRQLRWQRTQQCQAARCAPSFALRRSKDRLPDRHTSIGQSRRAITPIECSPRRLAVQRIRSKYPPAEPGALVWEPLKAAYPGGFGAVSHLLRGMRHQVPKLTILITCVSGCTPTCRGVIFASSSIDGAPFRVLGGPRIQSFIDGP